MYFQEQPYITEWFCEQVAEVEGAASLSTYGLIDRGIASGEFYEVRLAWCCYQDDAGQLPLAAAERAERPGDRGGVQHGTAARADHDDRSQPVSAWNSET